MEPKRVLVFRTPDDSHSAAVGYAIRRKGHICEYIYTADLPSLLNISLQVDPTKCEINLNGPDVAIPISLNTSFDTIWLRRHPDPILPEDMHPGDRLVAERQCKSILRGLYPLLDPHRSTMWVNHFTVSNDTAPKPVQLKLAASAGLQIPETLISNDPTEIRRFIRKHHGIVAYKLLEAATWMSADMKRAYKAYTATVSEDGLPDDATLRLSPGVFQELLKKQFEVRVACLGTFLVAVRINSQANNKAALDWRAGQFEIDMEAHVLPDDIANKCRHFMHYMRLAHASLDFVVDVENNYVFLEANPQGQFLWMEQRTGLPLLDMFSEFLIGKSLTFDWKEDHEVIKLSSFDETEWPLSYKRDSSNHIPCKRKGELLVID